MASPAYTAVSTCVATDRELVVKVAHGGRVHIYGNVSGNLTVLEGAKVIHSGVLGGDAINEGGRMFIDGSARVLGRVRTDSGETKVDSKAQIHQ